MPYKVRLTDSSVVWRVSAADSAVPAFSSASTWALRADMVAVSFLVMFFRADALAAMMNDTKAAPGIKAMAPAVICVGVILGHRQPPNDFTPMRIRSAPAQGQPKIRGRA